MRGLLFSGILTPTLRAKILRARIVGWSDADVIVCIIQKALALATFYFDVFLGPHETDDEMFAPKSGACIPRAF